MGRKAKVSYSAKLQAIEDYLMDRISMSQIWYKLEVTHSSVNDWLRKYKTFGLISIAWTQKVELF